MRTYAALLALFLDSYSTSIGVVAVCRALPIRSPTVGDLPFREPHRPQSVGSSQKPVGNIFAHLTGQEMGSLRGALEAASGRLHALGRRASCRDAPRAMALHQLCVSPKYGAKMSEPFDGLYITISNQRKGLMKVKLLIGLTAMVAFVAVSATPGGAWWKTRNQAKTTGLVTLGATTLETGAAKAECASAAGEWSIQTKGPQQEHQVVDQKNPENSKQVKTTFGPHLNIKIYQWNNCKAEVLMMKVPATVPACSFQLVQEQKGTGKEEKGPADVVWPCKIETSLCTISIPTGNEQTGANSALNAVKGKNEGQSVWGTAEVVGVHSTATCTKEELTNGKFKSVENGLKAEGLELA